jgi:hypothetical protein
MYVSQAHLTHANMFAKNGRRRTPAGPGPATCADYQIRRTDMAVLRIRT